MRLGGRALIVSSLLELTSASTQCREYLPFSLTQSKHANLDSIRCSQHHRLLAIGDGHTFTQCWVEDIRQQPGKLPLTAQMSELGDTKVKVMVLYLIAGQLSDSGRHHTIRSSLDGVHTPIHATSVPALFRKGTICLPFVTVLSRLGLKASPEKNVRSLG